MDEKETKMNKMDYTKMDKIKRETKKQNKKRKRCVEKTRQIRLKKTTMEKEQIQMGEKRQTWIKNRQKW